MKYLIPEMFVKHSFEPKLVATDSFDHCFMPNGFLPRDKNDYWTIEEYELVNRELGSINWFYDSKYCAKTVEEVFHLVNEVSLRLGIREDIAPKYVSYKSRRFGNLEL